MKHLMLIGRADHDNFGDSLMFAFYAQEAIKNGYKVSIYEASEIFLKRLIDIGLDVDLITENSVGLVDFAIFIGGGYFGEPDLNKNRWHKRFNDEDFFFKISNLLCKLNIPYSILGVEVGPLNNKITKEKVGNILKKAGELIVRNRESKCFIEKEYSLESEVYRDVVLFESSNFYPRLKPIENTLTIHSTGKFFKNNIVSKIFRSRLLRFIKENNQENIVFLFDQTTYPELKNSVESFIRENKIKKAKIVEYEGIHQLMHNISLSKYVITTKLHLGMVGLSYGAKVFCISNMRKNIRFYKELFDNKGRISLLKFMIKGISVSDFVSIESRHRTEIESSMRNVIKFSEIIEKC